MTDRHAIRLSWTVGGDPPEGKTVEDAIAELGLQLPEALT